MKRKEYEFEIYSKTVLGRIYLKSQFNVDELARRIDMSPLTLRRYLTGKTYNKAGYTLETFADICEALEVDIRDVIGDAVYDYI